MNLRLGTRASLLATTQARTIADELRALGHDVEMVEIVSEGDLTQAAGTSLVGSATGVFVNALRDALNDGRIDLAVHSLKDLPTAPAPGLVIAAIPGREDPADAVVARDGLALADLPLGARVGTGSPRRISQIVRQRPDLVVAGVRGNIDTRISKVHSGEYDAVILARAGLSRIGRLDQITEVLDPLTILPAPGQGALAVECRADSPAAAAIAALDDAHTRAAVTAERTLLAELEGGCSAPIGAYARIDGDRLLLDAIALSPQGTYAIRQSAEGDAADGAALGARLAQNMLAAGANSLSDEQSPQPTAAQLNTMGGAAAPTQESAQA
ncbi:porphobilinogen deaminase [Nocardioides baekrokdamisoli]|uniref:Porphobilinogen deaminase n=1 Tax=Nocardioides baekrokdamisoli TaxID=1804624 RepID=A0A3G9IFK6_9ACTN|nr:hydroxymethylbilane synthase [Nocardioides baekrokdamisoli]BBH17830.1 porphobilinogen deaminase [Nocardioides baekrokdamisoli]